MDAVGRKDDKQKVRLGLIPYAAMAMTAQALEYGAREYGEANYDLPGLTPERYLEAALRHIYKYKAGYRNDSRSGLPHLCHAAASLMLALHLLYKGENPEWLITYQGKEVAKNE